MSDDELFEQATLTICSSFDFPVALERCYQFLKTQFPLDSLYVDFVQKEQKVMRVLAMVSEARGLEQGVVVPLTKDALDFIEQNKPLSGGFCGSRRLWGSDNPVGQLMAPRLGLSGRHMMIQFLNLEGNYLASLLASAPSGVEFSAEDERRFSLLNEPFSIAVSNCRSYEQLVQLKDRLLADNTELKQQLGKDTLLQRCDVLPGLRNVATQVGQVAASNSTVLLLGETGVGKEVVANGIHQRSSRRNGPMIKVNCGAIPKDLIDSELFGHEKGAFSGATMLKKGYFERAHGGTIFLDEIGELPLPAQVRLLRVLQEREIERVGGEKTIPVDLRVIAATHCDLKVMVDHGLFREDLWFRLNVFPIEIPPLRKRREDIPVLLQHFLQQKSLEFGIRQPPEIAPGALSVLVNYGWPGNVRELENTVERALIQSQGRQKRQDPFALGGRRGGDDDGGCRCVFPCLMGEMGGQNEEPATLLPLDKQIAQHIGLALTQCGGKIHGPGGAAELLAMNPNTLRSKMRKLGISFH
jgi:transcriptional regulator with GAF, ATPase, and Fis domain